MKPVSIILLVITIKTNVRSVISNCPKFYANNSFIFLSGWPQSGTSLLQQIFTVSPFSSTMVKLCFEKRGKFCANVNNEVNLFTLHALSAIVNNWVIWRVNGLQRATEHGNVCFNRYILYALLLLYKMYLSPSNWEFDFREECALLQARHLGII